MSPFDDPSFVLAPLLMGVYGLILTGFALRSLWGIIPIYVQWAENEVHDVTHLNLPLPDGSTSIVNSLEFLGFRPLGIQRVRLFYMPQFFNSWTFLHESGETYVELVEFKQGQHQVLTGFLTWFPDEAYLETMYPVGENISEDSYSSHFASRTVENAYEYHRSQIENWRSTHGKPAIIKSLDDIAAWEKVLNRRYRIRKYRRITIAALLQFAVLLSCGTALIYLAAILSERYRLRALEITPSPLLVFALIGLPLVAIYIVNRILLNPPGAVDEHDTRKAKD
jgi:hypothetical protein